MEAKDKPKRNRVTLSIEHKIEILEKLDRGISNACIASEYNIGKSTPMNLMLLRELLDLAGQKRGSALKQKTMDCYFSNP